MWTNIDNALRSMSESINDWFENIGNTFTSMGESIKNFFSNKDEEEREETNDKIDQMGDTANQVESLINLVLFIQ